MKSLTISRLDTLDYATNEAINTLVTNISFAGSDKKIVMMTSCHPQEGKSFISVNLARTLGIMGKRVVLVDADLRKSALIGRYGILNNAREDMLGLSHYLANMCPMEEIIYDTNIANMAMVPVGRDVINSLMLLNTPRLSLLLSYLREQFDVVLVDAPPVGVIIDAAEIAKSCDGVLFVVSNNMVARRELIEATRQIEKTGTKILGAVLNKVTFDSHSAKKYYHKTYYTHYNNEVEYNQPRTRQRPKTVQGKGQRKAPDEKELGYP